MAVTSRQTPRHFVSQVLLGTWAWSSCKINVSGSEDGQGQLLTDLMHHGKEDGGAKFPTLDLETALCSRSWKHLLTPL